MTRYHGRKPDELRPIRFTRHYTKHTDGSVLVEFGDTVVLCTASVLDSVPKFLKDSGKGWVTAEYGMLPGSTHQRKDREAARGKQDGRTLEIQRLIGRVMRASIDLSQIKNITITLDCDVLQADGGTRTASICGASVALADAVKQLQTRGTVPANPIRSLIAAVSVGIVGGISLLDLDYSEDSIAETDMNIAMNDKGQFLEIQGTAEIQAFGQSALSEMLDLAARGIQSIIAIQQEILA